MRNDTSMPDEASGPFDHESRRGRTGWTRIVCWSRGRLVLLLAVMFLALSLPAHWRIPTSHASRQVHSESQAPITRFAFGPDSQSLATTDDAGRVKIWQADAVGGWYTRGALEVHGYVLAVAFAPDGRCLAVGYRESDMALWELKPEIQEHSWGILREGASQLTISPDGRTLALSRAGAPEIRLWDLDTGRCRMTLLGDSDSAAVVAFAPDGRTLASATWTSPRSILIWDLATGQTERRINGIGNPCLTVAYSPDGRWLASACQDRSVGIWNVQTGALALTIAGHSRPTQSVAFSPDGRVLATVSGDGTGSIWSLATGQEIRRLDSQAEVLYHVAFSPDGKLLAAAANDGDVRLWDVHELIGDRRGR
jgi:WD40 repeat protein